VSDYFTSIIRGGHLNSYILTYVNQNRSILSEKYPVFDKFKTDFNIDKSFMDIFFKFIEKEDSKLIFNEEEYEESESLLKLRIKAMIAQNIWGYSEFYQIYNNSNEILQRALKIIESNQYNKTDLAR
jgi:carboxyl-terminal processing protease